jgi:GTP cyclohydrolase III
MQDQAGIMKGSIDTLHIDIITAGGTIITARNQSPIKSTTHTRIKSIAITLMKSMAITQAADTAGIKLIVLADTNTPLKAIPTESLSN